MNLELILRDHPDLYLFDTSQGRVLFYTLRYDDYKSINRIMLSHPRMKFDLEDRVWEKCVLEHTFSAGKDQLQAGVITTVAQLILLLSAPRSVDQINYDVSVARGEIQTAIEQGILSICEAFPSYLPEDLEKFPWKILAKRIAQAESILKKDLIFEDIPDKSSDDSSRLFQKLDDYTSSTFDFDKLNRELGQD